MGTRKNTELAARRLRVSDMYLKGMYQSEIAASLDVSQPTISRDITALQKEWKESALVDFNEAKAEELAKVDKLEREYWDAWERSCEDAETIRQEGGPPAEGKVAKPDKIVKTAKGQAGDPRFLQGIQWCINKRCEIMGIDAPKRTDFTSGGEPIVVRRIGVDLGEL